VLSDKPDSLEICLNFNSDIESEDKLMHIDAVNHFIEHYNGLRKIKEPGQSHAPKRHFVLQSCVSGKLKTLNLTIQRTRYVPPSEQVLYAVISTAGILSILNGGLGIAWAGFSTTTLGINLSADLTDKQNTIYRQFSSSPYFHELNTVKRKHMKKFQVFMFELIHELEIGRKIVKSNLGDTTLNKNQH